ncbi:hypothetical protein FHL15_010144 [Xylaria flabelliformis]|uniref:Uncharacterized protein n=1 Tax=Xylaria flabelliformis TaxID=2512241 RepID=A0A553HLY3_9PEZI|nr:hypothetical protein FHL15_010144 [Xylaria flabelliformis]
MSPRYSSPKAWPRYGDATQHLETDGSYSTDKCTAWIGGVSENVAAAFSDSDLGSETMVVRPWHKRLQTDIWCFTSLVDEGLEEPITTFHRQNQEGGPSGNSAESSGDEEEEEGNNDVGVQQYANGNAITDQIWRINGQGQLINSETFNSLLSTLDLSLYLPDTEATRLLEDEQSDVVMRLATENRQLEALERALQFALTSTIGCTTEINLYRCSVMLYSRSPYPILTICMSEWQEDGKLSCYIAYYLLRAMLKCYRHCPFPDRLDVWEFGYQSRPRLLFPYGETKVLGETARVRHKIVEELGLRASVTG